MDKSQIEAAAAVAMESARPPFPDDTPTAIVQLIETGWSEDPEKRLPFDKIVDQLQVIGKNLSTEELDWIEMPLGHTVYRTRITMADLEIPPRPTTSKNQPGGEKKKTKGLRTLFSRKSTHF